MSLASKITFQNFCEVLENIWTARGNKKVEILKKFLDNYRQLGREMKEKDPNVDVSLYPVMRLLLVKSDKHRGPFGLKQINLGKLYVRVFCLGKTSTEAQSIINYRQPSSDRMQMNDFAERVYWILTSRLRQSGNLSIEQINNILDKIAEKNAQNGSKDSEFIHLQKCNAMEIKWFTRIILKDIKIGMGEKSIFEAYHPDADWYYGEKCDLKQVCDTLLNLQTQLERNISNVALLSPFKPMLLERLKVEEIGKLFTSDDTYVIQTKFDGERSQLHMKNGEYKYFTRHGLDITDNSGFGASKSSMNSFLTKAIADLINPQCQSIILDGELVGWHKEKKIFGSKGMSYDVKKLTSRSNYQSCFIAFDVILYNDRLLINLPLHERLKILEAAFKEQEGVLVRCKNTLVKTKDEVLDIFNKSMDNDDEGIVLKKVDSYYRPNSREGNCCYKLKAEYSDGLIEDIDMLILGGYYGENKYAGVISSFLMGVSSSSRSNNSSTDEQSEITIDSNSNLKFLSVGSVSSGLSVDKIKEINERFKPYWSQECPRNIVGPKKYLPDVWIEPKRSLVLQLRATEMIKCDYQPAGYTLRFPRVLRSREDKPWTDVCSLTELKSFIKSDGVVQKLTKRHATMSDVQTDLSLLGSPSKRLREIKEEMFLKPLKIDSRYFGVNAATVERKTRLFEAKEICVINGEEKLQKPGFNDEEKWTKSDIERILISHSAKIVQNPGKNTFCLIVGNPNSVKVQTQVNCRTYDVVKLDWLRRAAEKNNWAKLVDFYPWELLSCRSVTKERLMKKFDEYYDSYVEDSDEQSLKRSLERVCLIKNDLNVNLNTLDDTDKLINKLRSNKLSLFTNIVGYFADVSDWRKYGFLFMNGKLSNTINSLTTHVFVNNLINNLNNNSGRNNVKLVELYKQVNELGKASIKIIDSEWIKGCIEKHELLPETQYFIQ
ncbi:DNA ligase 4-like isoform X1 [Chelonus insularis]|uniref:DNA ligase 4-like isoform X1 n=1 Tax=Chelonus insularis TaxID=460826 RepID=UPI001589CB88|nr:DNA ligase 4-like isoform X1 [Chelonus insularis]XP_034933685.1 DNA ligase 4-like isoform X1 [Chelonus insularis]